MSTMKVTFVYIFSPSHLLDKLVGGKYTIDLQEDLDEYLFEIVDEFAGLPDTNTPDDVAFLLKGVKLGKVHSIKRINSDGDDQHYEVEATIRCGMRQRQIISESIACTEMHSPAILDC